MSNYTNLTSGAATFAKMMKNFGVVTVMNATVYNTSDFIDETNDTPTKFFAANTAASILAKAKDLTPVCTLETLKTANITVEGPDKEITGGAYNDTLIKFGKSATVEIQDALGNSAAIEALCGGLQEWSDKANGSDLIALHYGEDFSGPKTIIGDSFFIDASTGQQVQVKVMFYQFVPDSLFNLTQDAEGDATVFDMNGTLKTTMITTGDSEGNSIKHGVFYSILSGSAE